MTRESELLVAGATPATWEPWVALASLVALVAATFYLFLTVSRTAARRSQRLKPSIRIGVPLGFAVVCLSLYLPLLRFSFLRLTADVEFGEVLSGEKKRVPLSKRGLYRCYVEVRSTRHEVWSAALRLEACDRLVLGDRLSVPFVVSRTLRAVRQPGHHPHVGGGWLAFVSVAALTLIAIAAAVRRDSGSRIMTKDDLDRALRARATSNDCEPLSSDTIARARERWRRAMHDCKFDQRLPEGEKFVVAQLFGDPRPGEYVDLASFPIGARSDRDPNQAPCFWVRRTSNDPSRREHDEPFAGPIRLD